MQIQTSRSTAFVAWCCCHCSRFVSIRSPTFCLCRNAISSRELQPNAMNVCYKVRERDTTIARSLSTLTNTPVRFEFTGIVVGVVYRVRGKSSLGTRSAPLAKLRADDQEPRSSFVSVQVPSLRLFLTNTLKVQADSEDSPGLAAAVVQQDRLTPLSAFFWETTHGRSLQRRRSVGRRVRWSLYTAVWCFFGFLVVAKKKTFDPDTRGSKSRRFLGEGANARVRLKWNLRKNFYEEGLWFFFVWGIRVFRKCDYPNSVKTGDFLFGWILREECKKGVFFYCYKVCR